MVLFDEGGPECGEPAVGPCVGRVEGVGGCERDMGALSPFCEIGDVAGEDDLGGALHGGTQSTLGISPIYIFAANPARAKIHVSRPFLSSSDHAPF